MATITTASAAKAIKAVLATSTDHVGLRHVQNRYGKLSDFDKGFVMALAIGLLKSGKGDINDDIVVGGALEEARKAYRDSGI